MIYQIKNLITGRYFKINRHTRKVIGSKKGKKIPYKNIKIFDPIYWFYHDRRTLQVLIDLRNELDRVSVKLYDELDDTINIRQPVQIEG